MSERNRSGRRTSDGDPARRDGVGATGDMRAPAVGDERPSPDTGRPLSAIAERAIAVATRAPSAHNTQPWIPLVTSEEPDALTLAVAIDPDRTLPLADPLHMDTLLGIGCWVEAFAIACREDGADAELTGVEGEGENAVVTLSVTPALATGPEGENRPAPLSVREVTDRQVVRGRLRPDDAALEAAVEEFGALTPDAGELAIRAVPESLWRDMSARAALHIAQSPAMLEETLAWLRWRPSDSRWHEDGLTAECLRIPAPAATALAHVLGSRVGRIAVRSSGSWQPLLECVVVGRRHLPLRPRRATAGGPPTRIVVGTPAGLPATAADVTAREWITFGRELMRLWLVLHRHGLRVNVQSEIKDSPANAKSLARALGPGHHVPFATFSVGRSATPVPRSHRRSTGTAEF